LNNFSRRREKYYFDSEKVKKPTISSYEGGLLTDLLTRQKESSGLGSAEFEKYKVYLFKNYLSDQT